MYLKSKFEYFDCILKLTPKKNSLYVVLKLTPVCSTHCMYSDGKISVIVTLPLYYFLLDPPMMIIA